MTSKASFTGRLLAPRFIASLEGAAERTVDTYDRALRRLFAFLDERGAVEPVREDISAYRARLVADGCKPATIHIYITAARRFFAWAAREGIYPNVADRVKGARVDRGHKRDCLTGRQVAHMLAIIDRTRESGLRDYALIALLVTGGLRTIEAARANIADLRFAGGRPAIYVQGKGRTDRTEFVRLCGETDAALRRYIALRTTATPPEAPLFASIGRRNLGGRLTTRTISSIVKCRLRDAGCCSERLTAHSLRHTAVTLALLAGRDITEVQQFARHSSIDTTMIYNHALEASRNECSDAIAASIFLEIGGL